MRALALAALALAPACIDDDLVTAAEVIPVLELQETPDPLRADRVSRATVHVCTVDDDGRDPATTLTLRTTSGTWELDDDGDGAIRPVKLGDRCADVVLVAGVRPGPVTVQAELDAYTVRKTKPYAAATLDEARIAVAGALGEGTTELTVSVDIEVPGRGEVSIGTTAELTVTPTPANAVAYFTRSKITLDGGRVAETSLIVAEAATSVTIGATVTQPKVGEVAGTSKAATPVTIARP